MMAESSPIKFSTLDPNELISTNPVCVPEVKDVNSFNDPYVISDSLVKNLSCATLTPENVLSSLQDDAFSPSRQWPTKNWGNVTVENGLMGLDGQCYSLAYSQRRLFYLSRFNLQSTAQWRETRKSILDLIRPELESKVFEIPDSSLSSNTVYNLFTRQSDDRHFTSSVEQLQRNLFYRISNAPIVMPNLNLKWANRSESTNQKTMESIASELRRGRMPMLVVRASLATTHVILVKKIERLDSGFYELTCYDSNQPTIDVKMTYLNGQFYAPSIVGKFDESFSAKPIGVFIEDNKDMDEIQTIVYEYYRDLCGQIK
jgi:hypothetical protein